MIELFRRWLFGRKLPQADGEAAPPAPGWLAIEQALQELYGVPALGHIGHDGVRAIHDLREPPEYPLDGVSVWDGGDFWHYVGFGMSELYAKVSQSGELSGHGYELCLRLAKTAVDAQPPPLVGATVLQRLCQAQWSLPLFGAGHTLATGAMLADAGIAGFLLVEDPSLGTIDTPHGALSFLLAVGVDGPTLERALGGRARAVFSERGGDGVTVLSPGVSPSLPARGPLP